MAGVSPCHLLREARSDRQTHVHGRLATLVPQPFTDGSGSRVCNAVDWAGAAERGRQGREAPVTVVFQFLLL